jgi:hypothetical protein
LKRANADIRGIMGGEYSNPNTADTETLAVTDGAAYQ